MSSRTASAPGVTLPGHENGIDQLSNNEAKAKAGFDAAMTALEEKQERRGNPRPEDTRAELLKLDVAIDAAAADVDIARSAYERAHAALVAAEEVIAKEERGKLRADLLGTGAHLVRGAVAQYDKPLREMVMPFVNDVACYYRAVQEFNQALGADEEPIVNTFEEMRRTPGTPDQEIDVEVERRVRPEGRYFGQPGDENSWPLQKVLVKQIVPGCARILPTPLHEAFKAPALRPGDQNYRVEGTRDGSFIDVNGADY
jgi:hypothetical protein